MEILIKPIITEKATLDSEKNNRFTFLVAKQANKIQIRQAVEAAYGVSVLDVKTMNYGPKRSTRYTKNGLQHAQTNAYKKAVISLKEGDTIDFYSNI